MINGFLLCISFNFLSISNTIDIKEEGLQTLCNNAHHLNEIKNKYNIDPFIYASLIYYESRWQPKVRSHAGACGLSQVLHKYIKGVSCEDLFEPETALFHGAKNLAYWKKYKDGSISNALKCYSTGYKCSYSSYSKRILLLSKKIRNQYNQIKRTMDNG